MEAAIQTRRALKMPVTLDQFRESLRKDSESQLKQRLENCRAHPNGNQYAPIVQRELDTRFPGWDVKSRRGASPTTARFAKDEQLFGTAKAAYIWIVERFVHHNPELFTDIRWETTGHVAVGRRRNPNAKGVARNYFAKSPERLFLQTPSLASNSSNFHRISNGWYVNLNLNTRENFVILCRFSSVSKLELGKDWDWSPLNQTDELADSRRRTELGKELMKEFEEFCSQSSESTDRAN